MGILRLQEGLDVSKKTDEEYQNNQAKYNSCESLRRNQSYSHMSQGMHYILSILVVCIDEQIEFVLQLSVFMSPSLLSMEIMQEIPRGTFKCVL